MNSPASRQGNLVRYGVYLVGYLMVIGAIKLAFLGDKLHLWGMILFGVVALMILIFYVYRFNREERFFEKNEYKYSWLSNYRLIIILTLVIVAMRILISYLQSRGKIPAIHGLITYTVNTKTSIFWFMLVAQGVVINILQQYLANGFLFNYYFRLSDKMIGIAGMITSAMIFTVLNFHASLPILLIEFIFGMIFSWSYLYTQSLLMPVYLAVLNGVLAVILY